MSDRLVAIEICDVLLINVYLPSEDGSVKSHDLLHEILAMQQTLLNLDLLSSAYLAVILIGTLILNYHCIHWQLMNFC